MNNLDLAKKEWIAIKFYCNKSYRKNFIFEHRRLFLHEGLASTVKSWWNSAKEKTKAFLDGIKNIAGKLVPGSFLVGLSKLGDAGKKIWEFVSSLAGNAYKWLTDCVEKAKQFIEAGKNQLVANVLNLILKVIYPKNVNLYNQIVTACKQAGINTGLEPAQAQQQTQQVKEGIVGTIVKGANLVAGEGEGGGGNPRETVANLIETAFKTITDLLSDKMKQQIVETLFPFQSASMEAVGITLMIPLAQASGGLSFDTLVDFVQQIVNTIKHGAAKAAGKISLFREYKEFLLEIKSSFVSLLVKNFDAITGAIVGLIKGSNAEMLIRAAGGDAGAAKNVVMQLLKILVDAVKKETKETSDEEPNDEVLGKAADFLMNESKIKLCDILFNEGKKTWYGAQNLPDLKDEDQTKRITKDVAAKFDLSEFKKLTRQDKRLEYLQNTSMYIDAGSARIVYAVSPKKVIKLAGGSSYEQPSSTRSLKAGYVAKGAKQNKVEAEVWQNSSDEIRVILPRVYEVDSQFLWVLSELVRPLKSDNELKSMFGVEQKAYNQFMMGIGNVDSLMFKSFYDALSDDKKPIADAIVAMTKKFGLYSADLAVLAQWGKTADGRLVILDTGITTKNFAEY